MLPPVSLHIPINSNFRANKNIEYFHEFVALCPKMVHGLSKSVNLEQQSGTLMIRSQSEQDFSISQVDIYSK